MSNEELGVLEPEGVPGGVGTALVLFAWPEEEEEGDPGEIADGNVSCGGSLCGGVQGLDNADREEPQSCWRRILIMIERQLGSQPKIELLHAVVSGVVGSHGCEYFSNRAQVLLDQPLLDRLPLRGQKAGTDALGGNLEEGNGVLNLLEVGGDLDPAAEALPLAPGGGVFIEDGGR